MSKMILETLIVAVLCLGASVLIFMAVDDNGVALASDDNGEPMFLGSQRRFSGQNAGPMEGVGDVERMLLHGGLTRSYLVHMPQGRVANQPLPVMLAFHGGGGRAAGMRVMSRLNEAADRFGFLVVYPNGTGRMNLLTFNAGTCCGFAARNQVDDVGFVRALLADLPNHYQVDPKRIYATGLSNGAMLCYRLACELADKIAGIAPIAGGMGVDGPMPSRPVPIIHFHGLKDRNVPFLGGVGENAIDRVAHRPVSSAINFWIQANNCQAEPVESKQYPDYTLTRFEPAPGQKGAPIAVYALTEGGHNWPGGVDTTARLGTGRLIQSVDSDAIMWNFFEKQIPASPPRGRQ